MQKSPSFLVIVATILKVIVALALIAVVLFTVGYLLT